MSEDDGYWCMQLRLLAVITASSGDQVCPVIVEMLGFAAVKKNKERWFSESFFIHNKRNKMCLCVDTGNLEDNNDSSNDDDSSSSSHLSVSFFLMKGLHDDGLIWPPRGQFKVKLLNQVRDSVHHSETISFDEEMLTGAASRVMDADQTTEGFRDDKFISHEDFYNEPNPSLWQYVINDTVYFQVAFENSD